MGVFEQAWSIVKNDESVICADCQNTVPVAYLDHEVKEWADCPECGITGINDDERFPVGDAVDNTDPEEVSMFCEDVFGAMDSHNLEFMDAVRQVAELVGVDGRDLHRACVDYAKRGERDE